MTPGHEFLANQRLLVILPHADDESFGCAGTIARIEALVGQAYRDADTHLRLDAIPRRDLIQKIEQESKLQMRDPIHHPSLQNVEFTARLRGSEISVAAAEGYIVFRCVL